MGGGAWPFLVGGVICLVYSDNERDFRLLVGPNWRFKSGSVNLEGHCAFEYGEAGSNNRSVMPLDVLGCTRATLNYSTRFWVDRLGKSFENSSWWGLMLVIFHHERGIPSKCKSSTCVDYVPALCTHRPSHLPIGWSGEHFGFLASLSGGVEEKSCKSYHLEEGEVVTRFP